MMPNTVLWVEDDLGQVAPLIRSLMARGVEVTNAASLAEAEEALLRRRRPFDLIVLDNLLPDGRDQPASLADVGPARGWVFIREIRERSLHTGTIAVVSFFLPDVSERESLARSLGPIVFMDKNSLRLSATTQRLMNLLDEATSTVSGSEAPAR